MSLELQISHLLFQHDCVIIPGFGGFVANHRSSFLNPAHHTFSPPSKKIAFNSSLRISDGLFANQLSKELNVSYREANNLIEQFVKDCFQTLNNGERLTLEKVGELFFDAEKNLQFNPDLSINYLKDSFGLTTIHSPAIKREEDARKNVRAVHVGDAIRQKRKESGGNGSKQFNEGIYPSIITVFVIVFILLSCDCLCLSFSIRSVRLDRIF